MKRKKIVRWLALGIFVLLIGFTIASNLVYEALLPRVKTTEFIAGMSTEGEIEYWVPEECVFGTEDSQSIVLYRVGERSGLFSMEYYVEQIDGQVLEEKDAVFGRTVDGGYYLVGMKRPLREAFSLDSYGHANVLEETLDSLINGTAV